MLGFYEFFAGGGMARAGLGKGWNCLFANDIDVKKAFSYQLNWGTSGELQVGDIGDVETKDLPGRADMAWASFPCQDLSLAGNGAGLNGKRSGTFFAFWDVMASLAAENRSPRIIVLENVCGTLTSHGGADFAAICEMFIKHRYKFGALVINASYFVPQSRSRLFIIGIDRDCAIPDGLVSPGPLAPFHTRSLCNATNALSDAVKRHMLWWNIPTPPRRIVTFSDLIEDKPSGVDWHSEAETHRLLGMMTDINLAKVAAAQRAGRRVVGSLYKRTRADCTGQKMQRAEVRFDDVAGCLRTPGGGSSRQTILVIDGNNVRTRLISSRETARLMGLDEHYRLPNKYNEAYHLTGDGVAAPVVRHLAQHIFEPIILRTSQDYQAVA